jgi:sulfite reductase alpha subunit-like flavoprotein
MGNDVAKALAAICASNLDGSAAAGDGFVASLKADGRYVQELWS